MVTNITLFVCLFHSLTHAKGKKPGLKVHWKKETNCLPVLLRKGLKCATYQKRVPLDFDLSLYIVLDPRSFSADEK